MKALTERVRFDLIRYANCWEDARILCQALELGQRSDERKSSGIERRGRFLSIASGGDNSFALLASGADEVIAADLSPAQLAVVELKAAAIRRLERRETLAFLGLVPCGERLSTYARLETGLSEQARAFWSQNPGLIAEGLVHQGKFERYFALFRRFALPLIHRRSTIDELLLERDAEAQRQFYDEVWDTRRWRWVFHLFFSRAVMGRLGRDPELFRYVEGSVSQRLLARSRHALRTLGTHDNPYLEYILTGTFTRALPLYLQPEPYERLRTRLDSLTLELGSIEEVGRKFAGEYGFDGFNLSDIFEYLDPGATTKLYASLLEMAAPGARFAYWNMLTPRSCPEALRPKIQISPLGEQLFARDQAFFYSAFHVESAR